MRAVALAGSLSVVSFDACDCRAIYRADRSDFENERLSVCHTVVTRSADTWVISFGILSYLRAERAATIPEDLH
jgi:hypothetical protein